MLGDSMQVMMQLHLMPSTHCWVLTQLDYRIAWHRRCVLNSQLAVDSWRVWTNLLTHLNLSTRWIHYTPPTWVNTTVESRRCQRCVLGFTLSQAKIVSVSVMVMVQWKAALCAIVGGIHIQTHIEFKVSSSHYFLVWVAEFLIMLDVLEDLMMLKHWIVTFSW